MGDLRSGPTTSGRLRLLVLVPFLFLLCATISSGQNTDECVCVPYFQCNENGSVITDGADGLDKRNRRKSCTGVEVCCVLPSSGENKAAESSSEGPVQPTEQPDNGDGNDNSNNPITNPTPRPSSNTDSADLPTISPGEGCGRRRFPSNSNGFVDRITAPAVGDPDPTFYGEAPWVVRIMDGDKLLGLGSLVTPTVVLTAAHCVTNISQNTVSLVFGEWNTESDIEKIPVQTRKISSVTLHPSFNPRNLFNDIAVVNLDRAVQTNEAIDIVCIPDGVNQVNSTACVAVGWGDKYSGVPSTDVLMRKVELPLLEHDECQTRLRNTRLGQYFILNKSFMCAGGEVDKDTCRGDGGGPLYCPLLSNPNNLVQVGITSWGIECGKGNPSVFTDVLRYLSWIKQQIK